MEQFRQIGEVLGSMKALMVLQDDIQINRRQCCLLFDMFSLAFDTISEEIKENLRMEERNTKWKPLEQPLKELHRVFKEGELYVRQCMDSRDWLAKSVIFHNNRDCVEFHIQNLLCHYPIVIEAIETAGEISGLDLEEMRKKRIMLTNKYDNKWNDPKLFQWNYGKKYLVSQEICKRLHRVLKEDQWLLLETIREKKLQRHEQPLGDMIMKKLVNGLDSLFPVVTLVGAKDYQVRRRLGGGSQYKEIQWLGESFALRRFFGEQEALNSDISTLLTLSHPNVIQYLCGFHQEEKKEYFLVMELMNKDLNSYIKEVCSLKRQLPFSLPAAVDIMLQIARGMEYLHSKKIYHGDLNPSNVLIKPRMGSSILEGYFLAKVSGFGLKEVSTVPSRCSSPNEQETRPFIWYAPEVLIEQERPGGSCKHKYSEKADVYSFGMLSFELLTGKVPFEDGHLQGDKMTRNIKAGERPLFPFALPKYLGTLTKRCWQTDPNQRPSFSSICRILRYIKRLIVMNPHLAQPEIPSVVQVDFCDIEAGFIKRFPAEAAVDLTPVSKIPFHMFAYRLAEKERVSGGNNDKNWDSVSEVVMSKNIDERANAAEDSFSSVQETRSVCSEIPDKRPLIFKKANGIVADDQLLPTHNRVSEYLETPKKKAFPTLKRSNSIAAAGRSSPLLRDARLMRPDPQKKPSPLKISSTQPSPRSSDMSACSDQFSEKKAPDKKISHLRHSNNVTLGREPGMSMQRFSDTRSVCSEIPEKKGPEKKIPVLRRSNSVRASKDPG